MARRHDKTWSRRAALQLLYSAEMTDQSVEDAVAQGILLFESEEEQGAAPDKYTLELCRGVEEHQAEIDELIDSSSDNWSIGRMPIMDRIALRLAVYEMRYVSTVPVSVSIDEAVEIAKEFGGEDESHRFVNGVLGQVAKRLDGLAAKAEPADAAAEEK